MITLDKALETVLKHVRPLKTIRKPLGEVIGCCLGEDVRAKRDMPPADRSAMDGFAVRSADLKKSPRNLCLAGEVPAGSPARPRVKPGTCVRIFTGSNIPTGADAVVMVEQTSEADGFVTFEKAVPVGINIRKKGEEAAKGDVLLKRGTVLGSAQIGICAAVGKSQLRVYSRPSISILCTGNELRGIGDNVKSHELHNSNGPSLCAALKISNYKEISHQVVSDDMKKLVAKLKREIDSHDVIILTGGVSVGKYDYVPRALAKVGANIRFHGVAMKPGRPQLYATLPGNRHIFGLPGNPLSTITGFYELILPALRNMSGVPVEKCRTSLKLPLASPLTSKGDRVRLVLARLILGNKGPSVEPVDSQGSADLAAGANADGVVIIPSGVRKVPAKSLIEFRPWRALI